MVELTKLLAPNGLWSSGTIISSCGVNSGGWHNRGLQWAPLTDIAEFVVARGVVPPVVSDITSHTSGNAVTVERAGNLKAVEIKIGPVSPFKLAIDKLTTEPHWHIVWVKGANEIVFLLAMNRSEVCTISLTGVLSPSVLALDVVVLIEDLVLAVLESWPVWTNEDRCGR